MLVKDRITEISLNSNSKVTSLRFEARENMAIVIFKKAWMKLMWSFLLNSRFAKIKIHDEHAKGLNLSQFCMSDVKKSEECT